MSTTRTSIFEADGSRLASLLDVALDSQSQRLWQDDELGSILRHQLSAPMQVDLGCLERGLAPKIRTLTESLGLTLKSFGDLLFHPRPPLELLKVVKDFAKMCRVSPCSPLPHEIASVLYFACIASALLRCHSRITGLPDNALLDGFRWVQSRPWLDGQTRALIEQGMMSLNPDDKDRHDERTL